jgi:murein DD-endopeptidase MepM/ murein hydrolase activator NlpD
MGMIRIATVAAISFLCVIGRVAAGEMQAPRITRAEVDWDGAAQKLSEVAPLRAVHASADAGLGGRAIDRLNAAVAERLPGIAASPVPVLLPFDVETFLRDRAANLPARPDANPLPDPADKYFAGFGPPAFFAPGPAGYDATFRFAVAGIPELAGIRFGEPANVSISGSLLTYELDPPIAGAGAEVPALEADFPGVRRFFLENRVRYAFVRFGVPYVISIDCFDAAFARYHHMACRDAGRVIEHFLRALRIAGGAPHAAMPPAGAPAAERPAGVSPTFTYTAPGNLITGTGFRGHAGRADDTVYSVIRFPLAETPAFANTQYYQRRVPHGVAAYPWRDNFCEGRSYYVAQCPAGMGHQGQDIRAADCSRTSTGDDRCGEHHDDVVAVRDGTILRARGQEAVYLVINTPTEHIRFRYLHMRPKLLDAAGVVSGRRVAAGEVLGPIGNFSQHENGTSYHLHFDIQVPTRAGWVFVSPYMTLVSAYERLIGARGSEISDLVATAAGGTGVPGGPITLAAIRQVFLGADVPWPATASRSRAAACGVRLRRWRGCTVARVGHGANPARTGIKATQPQLAQPAESGEAAATTAVQGARILRHGHAAPAAVLAHRAPRQPRS